MRDTAEHEPSTTLDWLVLAAVLAPFIIGAVAVLTAGNLHPTFVGDDASNQLRISDVGRHAVLLGPYSRGTWNHPGPMMYYLLAIPYRLFGERTAGILLGALAINGAAALGSVVLARRLGGRLLMAAIACAVLVTMGSLGPIFLRDPWNPYLAVLPFLSFVMAAWGVAVGRWSLIPVAVVIGSFCVQTHAGYLPLVGILATASAVFAVRRYRTMRPDATLRRPLVWAGVVIGVLWMPTIVDQFAASHNLSKMVYYLISSDESTHGVAAGLRVVGQALSISGGWLTGHHPVTIAGEPANVSGVPWPVVAGLFVVVSGWRWRGADTVRRAGIAIMGATLVGSVITVVGTRGVLFDYRLRFLWVVAALTFAITLWLVLDSRPSWTRVGSTVLVVIAIVAALRPAFAATTPDPPERRYSEVAARLDSQLRDAALAPGRYLIRSSDLFTAVYLPSILVELEHLGLHPGLDDVAPFPQTIGRHRVLREAGATLLVVVRGRAAARLISAGWRPIAFWRADTRDLDRPLARLAALAHGPRDPQTARAVQAVLGTGTITVLERPRPHGAPSGA